MGLYLGVASKDLMASQAASSGRLRRNVIAWIGGLVLLSFAAVAGLLLWQALRNRAFLIEREKDSLYRLAQTVAIEIGDRCRGFQFFFATADRWLASHPRARAEKDPEFSSLTRDFLASMGGRLEVFLVSASGDLVRVPAGADRPPPGASDRSGILERSASQETGLHIGLPVRIESTGAWCVPVSSPLSATEGGFATILALVDIAVLADIYEETRPKPRGSIALIRRDGRLLARIPFDPAYLERPVADDGEAWWEAIGASVAFTLRSVTTDNRLRIIASKRLEDLGIAVSISAAMDDILAVWKTSLPLRGVLALVFISAVVLASIQVLYAMRRLGELQTELSGNVARLRESDATKDKLFSILAHDLRGPVGGICGLLDAIAKDVGSMDREDLGHYLSTLRVSSWNTYQLLENILAWARSKRGDVHFGPVRTRVRPLVEECAGVYALAMDKKGVFLEIDVDPSLEARADPDLLKVVLRNLVSNALKFSKAGGRIRASGRAEDGGVRIAVRDEGIGMDEGTKERVFDLAGTKSRAGTASEGGSGLGLVLCRDIMALHGGRISVDSSPGKGSSFTVFLPDEA